MSATKNKTLLPATTVASVAPVAPTACPKTDMERGKLYSIAGLSFLGWPLKALRLATRVNLWLNFCGRSTDRHSAQIQPDLGGSGGFLGMGWVDTVPRERKLYYFPKGVCTIGLEAEALAYLDKGKHIRGIAALRAMSDVAGTLPSGPV